MTTPVGGLDEAERELESWLAFALACCDEADELAMRHFRRDLVIEAKPDRTFVTQADQAIERAIRDRITAAYPDHGLVGEEYGEATARAGSAGTSTRSTGRTTSCAACPSSGRWSPWSGTGTWSSAS